MIICHKFPNLKDRVDFTSKCSSLQDLWLSSVRLSISNSYRCRKSRCKKLNIDRTVLKCAKDFLKNFRSLSASKILKYARESFTSRRAEIEIGEISEVLQSWPFLTMQEGLRMEFKILTKKINIQYIIARLRRAFPSIEIDMISPNFFLDLETPEDIEKIPEKYGDNGKIICKVIIYR